MNTQVNSKLSSNIRLNGIVQKFNCCAGRSRLGRRGSTIPESANDPPMIKVKKISQLTNPSSERLSFCSITERIKFLPLFSFREKKTDSFMERIRTVSDYEGSSFFFY